MTDGEPYGERATAADIDAISSRVAVETEGKKYFVMGIGVGEANMDLLRKMCGKALPLAGTKFTEFFKWLSNSLSMVSKSKEGDKVNISEGSDSWMNSFEEEGIISGGMIPKVDCCIEAIDKGVKNVIIMDGRVPHSILMELLTDEGAGTMVVPDKNLCPHLCNCSSTLSFLRNRNISL